MIVLTGAAGFIGSNMLSHLLRTTHLPVVIADNFTQPHKAPNYAHKPFYKQIPREALPNWLALHGASVQAVIHLGARTDTTEQHYPILEALNVHYTQAIWYYCTLHQIPLIYASSAATYGNGSLGYSDNHTCVAHLQPLNPYGHSKNELDKWALTQTETPPYWYGLKFFNVYGPNEYHKGRMASVVWHTYHTVATTQQMSLFRSHRPDIADGEQSRDFVWVGDVIQVIEWLLNTQPTSGLYNVGSGTARTFNDLANNVFEQLQLPPQIHYIDTPTDIRNSYQYYTQADLTKLRQAGYTLPTTTLEEGIRNYIQGYLVNHQYA
jgi:ADP-L-glycero-D-manno-heptose 6-epimerase